jgi:Nuclear RNA-splicing-associated protein
MSSTDSKVHTKSQDPKEKHGVDDNGGGGDDGINTDQPPQNRRTNMMVPMTREQYEVQQSQIKEVYDPLSGRTRLVRGDGEIIERIVSRQTHQQINQQATRGDGSAFARSIFHQAAGGGRRWWWWWYIQYPIYQLRMQVN